MKVVDDRQESRLERRASSFIRVGPLLFVPFSEFPLARHAHTRGARAVDAGKYLWQSGRDNEPFLSRSFSPRTCRAPNARNKKQEEQEARLRACYFYFILFFKVFIIIIFLWFLSKRTCTRSLE